MPTADAILPSGQKGKEFKMNKPEKTNQNLSGVKCDVKECYYNSNSNGCQAEKIHVSTCQTCDGVKTDCATFTQK